MQAMHARERESDEGLLTIDGFRCRYQVTGTESASPPVFFLSGAFQTMESWRKFARPSATRGAHGPRRSHETDPR